MSQGVEVDTSKLDVKVDDGVVRLHGEVQTPDLMSELERLAAQVSEVRRVENLLHLPKPPTPSPTDAVASQGEASEELSAPTSGLRPSDFAAARKEPGRAPGGSAGEPADPADGSPAGDQAAEDAGPDAAELEKDQAYQPSDPGLNRIKGG
jgi:hypothetical protein